MKNQIEIVKEIADSMYGIGGIETDTNEVFYAEFDMRLRAALGIGIRKAEIGISACGCTHTQVCRICASAKDVDWDIIQDEIETEAVCVLSFVEQNKKPSKSQFFEIIRDHRPDINLPKNMNAYDLNENGGFKTKK